MDNFFFLLTKVLTALVLPPIGLLVLALLALWLRNRWPRSSRATLWFSVCALLVLSLPIVARGLVALLDAPPLEVRAGKSARAIIILGGGIVRSAPEYGGDTLSAFSLARTRYGATLAKRYHLPILVTGGQVYGGTPEAQVMAQVLAADYGVPAKWVEDRARHTGENLRFAAELLKKDGVRSVILVTHDTHMRRSLAHCAAAGLICYSAPVTSLSAASDSWIEQLPNPSALQMSWLALHEFAGNLALRWR